MTVSDDLVHDYFARIRDRAVLTSGEEHDLARDIEAGVLAREALDHEPRADLRRDLRAIMARGLVAEDTLIACNLKLVVSVARRYTQRGVPLPDLIQDGNLGLIRAMQGFDFTKGFRFSTYATFWIKESIEQGITVQANVIKVPHYQLGKLKAVKKVSAEFARFEGREPTRLELAADACLDPERLDQLLAFERPVASLAAPVTEGIELGDVIPDDPDRQPVARAAANEEFAALRAAVSELDAHERRLVSLAYGLGGGDALALPDLARVMATSRRTVSDHLATSIERLRNDDRLLRAIAS